MNSIKILSWNILGPETKDVTWFAERYPAITDWHNRFMLIIQKILHLNPDIICLQEVGEAQKHPFESALFHHGFILGSYASKGPHGGVIIFYKKHRFSLIHLGQVHMNPHQTFHHPSACAWIILQDKINHKSLLISSAHFQPQYILEQISEFFQALMPLSRTIPIIIAGDFNTKYKKMTHEIIESLQKLHISDYSLHMFYHESWTHQSTIKHDGIGGFASLDHVLYTNNFKLDSHQSFIGNPRNSYKTDLTSIAHYNTLDASMIPFPNKHNPSDHLPLLCTVLFAT